MKISFFDIQGWEVPIIRKSLSKHKLEFFKEPLNMNNYQKAKNSDIISVFIYSRVSEELIKKLPKLKLILTRSTGYDHIAVPTCKKCKIKVCNRPEYGSNTVAEHTFALILAVSRKLYLTRDKILKEDFTISGLKGFDLDGKTLGVLGAGRIGKHVIRIARGFNMNVLVSDDHPDKFLADELNFKYVSFKELIKKADILTIHIPYTPQNHHLINKEAITQMKKGAVIINTARGPILDNSALIWGLNTKHLAGAGLDVIEGEDLIKEEKQLLYEKGNFEKLKLLMQDHDLIRMENVVFTPHVAFYSDEALHRIIEHTIIDINSFLKGGLKGDSVIA